MRERQTIFSRTGGLHAAAIFDANGVLLACYEDIGRHNATDCAIGLGLQSGWMPATQDLILLVSGRVSFEIVQKALRARIGTVAGVSAASSLAIDLARANNLNSSRLDARASGLTVYTGQTALAIAFTQLVEDSQRGFRKGRRNVVSKIKSNYINSSPRPRIGS